MNVGHRGNRNDRWKCFLNSSTQNSVCRALAGWIHFGSVDFSSDVDDDGEITYGDGCHENPRTKLRFDVQFVDNTGRRQ